MWLPPCDDNKVWKSANQIPNPSLHPPFASHDSVPMEGNLEWLMKPMVKTNSSTPQDDSSILNLGPKSYSTEIIISLRDIYHPLSSTCHDSLYHDPPDQFGSPTSPSHSLDFQVVGSNCD